MFKFLRKLFPARTQPSVQRARRSLGTLELKSKHTGDIELVPRGDCAHLSPDYWKNRIPPPRVRSRRNSFQV